ncbi:carbohydrate-binding protein [Motilimonas sp. KMU-193]|uniref:carbohydrate-binding protein n=1 Tax=Motilimonas sp. KMU-193 TaxID=3388668 RepID=UPI00396AF118
MKLIFPLGLVALLGAGQVNASCMVIPDELMKTSTYLTVEQPKPNLVAQEWQPEQIYQKGDVVRFGEEYYQARWWSQFEAPGPAWVSWERIKQDSEQWQQEQVYEQGDKVLFEGRLYQAQYWNQGNSPAVSGAWSLDPQGEKMLASQFVITGYGCVRPPSDFYSDTYWESTSNHYLRMLEEVTDEILYDYVIIEYNGEISTVPFEVSVEGVECSGQQACNAVLDGQAKAVVYKTGYSYMYRRTHGTYGPTPEPTMPPAMSAEQVDEPNSQEPASNEQSDDSALVKYCNQDHLCRAIEF